MITIYMTFYAVNVNLFKDVWDVLLLPHARCKSGYIRNEFSFNKLIEQISNPQNKQRSEASQNKDKGANSILETRNPKSSLYVFALDISKSTNFGILRPFWLENIANEILTNQYIEKSVSNKIRDITKQNYRVNAFDVAKLRLFEMLVKLSKMEGVKDRDSFAIWSIGTKSKRLFPDPGSYTSLRNLNKALITDSNIVHAIEQTIHLTANEFNTDFDALLTETFQEYQIEEFDQNIKNDQQIIITFISDLLHDTEIKYKGRIEEIKKNWAKVVEKIQNLNDSRIIVNLIVITKDGKMIKGLPQKNMQLFPIFKEKIEWFRISDKTFDSSIENKFLYPKQYLNETLSFYYENERTELNSIVLIFSEDKEITFYLPKKIGFESGKIKRLKLSVFGSDKKTLRSTGWLTYGEELSKKISENQSIHLDAKIVSSIEDAPLCIISKTDNKSYFINITFRQVLNKQIAIIMKTLQYPIIGIAFTLSCLFIIFLYNFSMFVIEYIKYLYRRKGNGDPPPSRPKLSFKSETTAIVIRRVTRF